jgi:hypothetical protein
MKGYRLKAEAFSLQPQYLFFSPPAVDFSPGGAYHLINLEEKSER